MLQSIFKLKSFYAVAILATVLIYVALVNFNRVFVSETELIVIPKSPKGALASSQIPANLSGIFASFSFLEKLEKNHPELLSEAVLELSAEKRKAYWQEKISAVPAQNSGLLKISARDKSRQRAESLAEKSSRQLIFFVASFYDVKNDLDIRILDQPFTRETLSQSLLLIILQSLLWGFALSFVSFALSFYFFSREENLPRVSFDFSAWKPQKKELEKVIEEPVEKVTEKKEEKTVKLQEEIWIPSLSRSASAPHNLPVAPEESAIEEEKKEEEILPEEENKTEEILPTREATPEEVKERLNKLLSGKF